MKLNFDPKLAIFFLALAVTPTASRAESSVRALTERFLSLADSREDKLRLRGFEQGHPERGCEVSVIQSDRIDFYEIRLSTIDLGRTYPISSAEGWKVVLSAGSGKNFLAAVGNAKFQQVLPGFGIPVGTKYVRHEFSAERAEPDLIRVSLKHSVSGLVFGDSNYTLACDFPLN